MSDLDAILKRLGALEDSQKEAVVADALAATKEAKLVGPHKGAIFLKQIRRIGWRSLMI